MLSPPAVHGPPVGLAEFAGGVVGESDVGADDGESDADGEASVVLGAAVGLADGASLCAGDDAEAEDCAPRSAPVEAAGVAPAGGDAPFEDELDERECPPLAPAPVVELADELGVEDGVGVIGGGVTPG